MKTILISSFVATTIICISTMAAAQSDALKLRITGTNNYYDETVIRFLPDATNGFDQMYDAWKLFSWYWEVPSLYTALPNGDEIAINSLPSLTRDIKVDLHTWVNIDDSYTFDFIELFAFAPNIDIYMYDKQSGAVYDLLNTSSTTIHLDANIDSSARFELHFSLPATVTALDESCYDADDGEILINDPGNINWSYSLMDNNNNLVATGTNINDSILVTGLSEGQYTVISTTYYGITDSATISVNAPDPIVAAIAADQTTVYISGGATVTFQNATSGATDYLWDFGDNNTSSDFEPVHSYSAEGVYTVTMTASTGNCSDLQTLSVIVIDDVTSIETFNSAPSTRIIRDHFGYYLSTGASSANHILIELYSLEGKQVYSRHHVEVTNQPIYLDLNYLPEGIYIARIVMKEHNATQKIFIN